jgi:chemotaxis protein MotB
VLFRPGAAVLRPESRDTLEQIVAVLQTLPGYLFRIEGHTDDVPISGGGRDRWPTNWELSAARAAAVVRYLQERRIPPEQLVASGYAFYRPLAPNDTPEGRAQNRRVEITVLPLPPAEHRPVQR